jgi:DNA/RNA-binding domain of Phe-tRNA-synthetase-like protein
MELRLVDAWIEPELADEFPQLGMVHTPLQMRPGSTPPEVKERLRALADRYTGGKVIHMRQDAVPWAYRVFSRQVGIDPDSDRTPVEQIALDRLRHGGLRSENLLDDALTIAIAETGVPVFALDADKLEGEPGLRLSRPGERLSELRPLSARQLVVADASRPVAVVLGEVSHEAGVTPATERMVLCALRVKGVPPIAIEEALWVATETLVGHQNLGPGGPQGVS